MTTQRKIFGALLTLAASAFGVDRFWLGPASAPAQAPASPPAMHAPAPRRVANDSAARGPSAQTVKPAPAKRTLAARLLEATRAEQIAPDGSEDTVPVPDAFRPSSLWYPTVTTIVAAPPAPVISPERIAEFRTRHRLTAIMKSSQPAPDGSAGGLAIIGGKVYLPGQSIDEFTLVSLGERTARLSCRGVLIDLAIDPPDALTSLSGQ